MLLLCCACGSSRRRGSAAPARTAASTPAPGAAPAPRAALTGPALGLTEDNADLLWNPAAAGARGPFAQARSELTALHPSYLRLLIDWAALQPSASAAPALAASASGCAREVGPCGAYAGVRAELAALASQHRAARARGQEAFQVVIDIFGAPVWAAAEPAGCELPQTSSFARPLRPAALSGYRALIGSLLALGSSEGVTLHWWSPWNEPNDPRFVSPQRASCTPSSAPVSAQLYAELAAAMAQELDAVAGAHQIILGELDGLTVDSPHTTSIQQFVASLPQSVLCLGSVWSVHAYASYGPGAAAAAQADAPLQALEAALDARGGCAARAPIWITEAGAGAPHAGQPRPAGAAAQREGCEALAGQLARWYSDPRVGAVFQYSFREDPDFQVGLVSADLDHVYPTYWLWLSYTRTREAGEPPAAPATACAAA